MVKEEEYINQIAKTTEVAGEDFLIVEKTIGTKIIKYTDLVEEIKRSLGIVDTLEITEKGYLPEGYLVADALNNKQAQIRASWGYFGKEIPFTWEEIEQKTEAGDFSEFNVGDYKDIVLTTGEKVRMEIAGINTYKGYRSGNANRLYWISRDCLEKKYAMNPANTNAGGFPDSALKTTLNTTIYNTLPPEVKAVIKTDKRLCSKKGTWAWQEDQKLWLPSEVEIWGKNIWSEVGYGNGDCVQFPIFANSMIHINKGYGFGKAEQGAFAIWWSDSPEEATTTNFCNVSSNGIANGTGAANEFGVPLCFTT